MDVMNNDDFDEHFLCMQMNDYAITRMKLSSLAMQWDWLNNIYYSWVTGNKAALEDARKLIESGVDILPTDRLQQHWVLLLSRQEDPPDDIMELMDDFISSDPYEDAVLGLENGMNDIRGELGWEPLKSLHFERWPIVAWTTK